MTVPTTTTEDPSAEGAAEHTAEPRFDEAGGESPLVDADLLVEEVSIDGMCGVY